jgi:DNA-binding NarL/FixJ family response regulator
MSTDQLTRRAVKLHTEKIPAETAKLNDYVSARDEAVTELHERGLTYAQIAAELGCSIPYIQVMVQREKGALPPSRQPARKKAVKQA